jgi:ATP-dependent DNA helicase DinG
MRSRSALGADGPLARRVPGFVPRPSQQAMARAVEAALDAQRTLIVESGTGTGKTFAYLVPALLSGQRVLISSGTRNLQDQLYRRDLPVVREALAVAAQTALLKGRSNYLCRYRFARTDDAGQFLSRAAAGQFDKIRSWVRSTQTGDIAEIGDVAEESELWPLVTSTADNCLGGECPNYADCFVVRARRRAAEAELVVVNHHLFFADMSVREEGFAQLLPAADAVIFDEAHQLPDIATSAFSTTLSSHRLHNLCRDTIAEDVKDRSGLRELRGAAETTERALLDARLTLGRLARTPWRELAARAEVASAFETLRAELRGLAEILHVAAGAGAGLANCARRVTDLEQRLAEVTGDDDLDRVSWVETGERSFVLRLTPLDVAQTFQQRVRLLGTKSWVYTSATLAVGTDFSFFAGRLGLDDADTARWTSPFDYARCALLYVPASLPDPGASDFTERVIEAALPALQASGGRAFLLFTSHRALRRAAELLKDRIDYPLLVQGSMSRTRLLERFVEAGDAVLLGTGSFWEGVDVRGPALSCVIIDKLPFAAPDDPVLKARAIACAAAGGNPFFEQQLPEAVIALKQGAGRLIRSADDSGVLMLCDPRLYGRRYGRLFLESLPPMPVTRNVADVENFFRSRVAVDNAV